MTPVARSANPDDVEAIAAIEEAIEPGAWPAAVVRRQLDAPSCVAMVAIDTEVVGHVITTVAADEAEVLTLAVAGERRRTGVATALMRAIVAAWAGRGVARAFLEVRVDNVGARALYGRLGFAEVGRRPAYYSDGTDALLLRLDLSG